MTAVTDWHRHGTTIVRTLEDFSINDDLDQWLFQASPLHWLYGLALPATAAAGVAINLFAFCVFIHPDMKSMSTLLLNANLVADSLYLIFATITSAPEYWIHHLYKWEHTGAFWKSLSVLQTSYIMCYPFRLVSQVASSLFTASLALEQFAAFYMPSKLQKWTSTDKGLKFVVTLFNVCILIHLISFFKFSRRDVILHLTNSNITNTMQTPNITDFPVQEICISAIYRGKNYQTVDKYIFYVIFDVAPLAIVALLIIPIFVTYARLKKEFKDTDMSSATVPDVLSKEFLQVFKSGRSVDNVLAICTSYLVLRGACVILYGLSYPYMYKESLNQHCHLKPMDYRFANVPTMYAIPYRVCVTVNCCIKPFLCLYASYQFRSLLASCLCFPARLTKNAAEYIRDRNRRRRLSSSTSSHMRAPTRSETNTTDVFSLADQSSPLRDEQDNWGSQYFDPNESFESARVEVI